MTYRKIDGFGVLDECPVEWGHLELTDKPDKRLFRTCNRFVHVCDSSLQFELYAKAEACVAVSDTDCGTVVYFGEPHSACGRDSSLVWD